MNFTNSASNNTAFAVKAIARWVGTFAISFALCATLALGIAPAFVHASQKILDQAGHAYVNYDSNYVPDPNGDGVLLDAFGGTTPRTEGFPVDLWGNTLIISNDVVMDTDYEVVGYVYEGPLTP